MLAIIKNKLATEQDIINYHEWMATKTTECLQSILLMIETDVQHRPGRWYNVETRMHLLRKEIAER